MSEYWVDIISAPKPSAVSLGFQTKNGTFIEYRVYDYKQGTVGPLTTIFIVFFTIPQPVKG